MLMSRPASANDFTRGDANHDHTITIADVIFILQFVYQAGPAPECMDAADVNDDGLIDIGDPIKLLGQYFAHGFFNTDLPPEHCGPDPSTDNLSRDATSCF